MKLYKLISNGLSVLALLALVLVPAQGAEKAKAKTKGKPMPIKVSSLKGRPPVSNKTIAEGKRIYNNACIFCHGTKGDGKGPVAYFLSRDTGPHPRDFTFGVYKLRSTASGELPLDEDLFRTITKGIPGFMPGFVGLKAADRWKLVYYIKSLYPDFKGANPEPLRIVGQPAPASAMSVKRGYRLYQKFKCWECHGDGGLGDGKKAPDLKDDWGFRLPPMDLTMLSAFKNGRRPEDIYRTIMGGLDGGAMPSYADFLAGKEREAWHLVNYILSLSEE